MVPGLLGDVTRPGLGEDGADRRGDHLGTAFGHLGQDVPEEVDPAPLPRCSDQHRPDGGLQPGVGVGDDQLHPGQASGAQ